MSDLAISWNSHNQPRHCTWQKRGQQSHVQSWAPHSEILTWGLPRSHGIPLPAAPRASSHLWQAQKGPDNSCTKTPQILLTCTDVTRPWLMVPHSKSHSVSRKFLWSVHTLPGLSSLHVELFSFPTLTWAVQHLWGRMSSMFNFKTLECSSLRQSFHLNNSMETEEAFPCEGWP